MTRTLCDLASLTALRLSGVAARQTPASRLLALQSTVHRELSNPALSPSWLAQRHLVSLRLVHTVFSLAGITPAAYIRQQRIARARQLLRDRALRIVDVAVSCGFSDASTFARAFERETGMTPSEYRALLP